MVRRGLAIGAILAAFALSPRAAFAQAADLPSPLKVTDVLAWARAHRAEIQAAKAKSSAVAETPKVVSALPDPMVMGSIDHLPFKMGGVDWSIMVQQDFPLGGILGARKREAEAKAKAAEADVGTVSLDVELQALDAYLMRVESDRMKVVLDEQRTIAEQVLVVTRARLVSGDTTAADVLRAESDVARIEGEMLALDADTIGASAMLNATLARPVDALLPPLSLTVPSAEPAPVSTLVTLALQKRPELASMRAASTAATANVDVMEAMYTPMAFVRIGTARTMESGQGAMLMLGITIPLWREKLESGVNEAKSMVAMADADLAATKKMIEGDVATARAQVMAARARWASLHDKVVPLAQKAVTLMTANFAGGQSSLVAVLDASRALREARMQEVAAEIALGRAWARLSRTTGTVALGGA